MRSSRGPPPPRGGAVPEQVVQQRVGRPAGARRHLRGAEHRVHVVVRRVGRGRLRRGVLEDAVALPPAAHPLRRDRGRRRGRALGRRVRVEQLAVHDDVRVPADRRGEVRVGVEAEAEVAEALEVGVPLEGAVLGGEVGGGPVARLPHAAHEPRLQEVLQVPFHAPRDAAGRPQRLERAADALRRARGRVLRRRRLDADGPKELQRLRDGGAAVVRRRVRPDQGRLRAPPQQHPRDARVREHHELLYDVVNFKVFVLDHLQRPPAPPLHHEAELPAARAQLERAAALAPPPEPARAAPQRPHGAPEVALERRGHRRARLPGRRRRGARRVWRQSVREALRLRVGHGGGVAEDGAAAEEGVPGGEELLLGGIPREREAEEERDGGAVPIALEGAEVAAEHLRQHVVPPVGQVHGGTAPARGAVERRVARHEVRHVRDVDADLHLLR